MNQKYIDMVYGENHLEHHGIQGQKWGVTNGPPYPLGQNVCAMLGEIASGNKVSAKQLREALNADSKSSGSGEGANWKDVKNAAKEVKNSSNPEATLYTIQTQSDLRSARENAKKMSDEELLDKTIEQQKEVNRLSLEKMYTDTMTQKYSLIMETKYNTSVDSKYNYGLDKGAKSKDDLKSEKAVKSEEGKTKVKETAVKVGKAAAVAAGTLALASIWNKQSVKDTVTQGLDNKFAKYKRGGH